MLHGRLRPVDALRMRASATCGDSSGCGEGDHKFGCVTLICNVDKATTANGQSDQAVDEIVTGSTVITSRFVNTVSAASNQRAAGV